MKYKNYLLPLLCMGAFCFGQDKISMKNGDQVDAKVMEVNPSVIIYKESDNPEGPLHSISKSDIYRITYSSGKIDVLGKYSSAEEAKKIIVSAINKFGVHRNISWEKLQAEFKGDLLRINSINKKGSVVEEGDFWDLGKVVEFHKISFRSNNVCYLNIITDRIRNSKPEVDKLVIKMTDYQAGENVLNAMKDLQIMLRKN